MAEEPGREERVDRSGPHGERVHVGEDERAGSLPCTGGGRGQHLGCHVDADDRRVRSRHTPERGQCPARAAPEVDDDAGRAGEELGGGGRVCGPVVVEVRVPADGRRGAKNSRVRARWSSTAPASRTLRRLLPRPHPRGTRPRA